MSVISAVSLDEIKSHLRIDSDDEDSLLLMYAEAATAYAEQYLCREIIKRNDEQAVVAEYGIVPSDSVPSDIKFYVLAVVGDYYRRREMSGAEKLTEYHVHAIDRWKLYNRGDDWSAADE